MRETTSRDVRSDERPEEFALDPTERMRAINLARLPELRAGPLQPQAPQCGPPRHALSAPRPLIPSPPALHPERVRALVFDLDGTLVDSYRAIAASLNHVRGAHG